MKRKRTNKLSCERARAFPIEKALAKLGHFPSKSTGKEAWFLNPFRPEAQASFKVSKKLNRWYDHGAGKGGNVIDLVYLVKKCSVRETVEFLATGQTSFSFHLQPIFNGRPGAEDGNVITDVGPLVHPALKQYIKSRNITMQTTMGYCREVRYRSKGNDYFAIGLKNDVGGWELRNKYQKNCSSPKDVTHIKDGNGKLIVTEGMFDLLSILKLQRDLETEHDFLVLNSTAFVRRAIEIIQGYPNIELYLDKDQNGKRTARILIESSENCRDRSPLYEGFKDVSDYRTAGGSNRNGQGIQDVLLWPQKRSCFAPDGCKL